MTFKKMAKTKVANLMRSDAIVVTTSTPLGGVIDAMHERRRGAALVVDRTGLLVGIVTERDLMLRVDHKKSVVSSLRVTEVMTRAPVAVLRTTSVRDAVEHFRRGGFRHLPVVDGDGAPAGIISVRDVVRHVAEMFPREFLNLPPDPGRAANGAWGG